MATGPKEVRKEDEGQAPLPEVHRRDEADSEEVHHLWPVRQSRPIPLLGAWRKREHERADTPVHPERHGLQRADR